MSVLVKAEEAADTRLGSRAWLGGLLLSAAVIAFCLETAELILRQWFPVDQANFQADARYLFGYIPNSRHLKRPLPGSGAPPVLIEINSQGRRGAPLRNDGRRRVIVYGDSFIAAEGTPLQKTFVAQLEQILNVRLRNPLQIINAGVPGFGPDQESLVMEDEIARVKPSLVVFAIYSGNDFGDLCRDKLFRLDSRSQLVRNYPTLDAKLLRGFERARRQQPSFQIARRANNLLTLVRTSGPANRLKTFLHAGHPYVQPEDPFSRPSEKLLDVWLAERFREYKNYVLDHDNQVHNLLLDGYDADISTSSNTDSARYKIALMDRIMQRIQNIAVEHSTPLLFLIIPSPIDVLDKWDMSVNRQKYPDYRSAILTDTLEGIATEHHFQYVNLFGPFHDHQAENLFYHGMDDHWNARGQRLAAVLLADYIWRNDALRAALAE
jgi:hypothetical protein